MKLLRTAAVLLFIVKAFADTQKHTGGQFALAWLVVAGFLMAIPMPKKSQKRI